MIQKNKAALGGGKGLNQMVRNFKDGTSIEFESVHEREARLRKIALDLYERCKSEKITFRDAEIVIEMLAAHIKEITILRD